MTKVIRLYCCTYGSTKIELAKSETGKWFTRKWGFFSGWGYTSSAWKELGKLIRIKRHSTRWENLNGNEITSHTMNFYFEKHRGAFEYKLKEKVDIDGCKYKLPC